MGNKHSSHIYENPYLAENFSFADERTRIIKKIEKTQFSVDPNYEDQKRFLYKQLLSMPPHKNVMKIYSVKERKNDYSVEMEKMNGAELFEYLIPENYHQLNQKSKKYIIFEILSGIKALHDIGVIHRDIKPENIMFKENFKLFNKTNKCEIAIIDLDSSFPEKYYYDKITIPSIIVGTPAYMSPELIITGKPTRSSDIWAIGIILYIIISGTPPFPMQNMTSPSKSLSILRKYECTGVDFFHQDFLQVPLARDLCRRMLQYKVQNRLSSVDEALNHEWFNDIRSPSRSLITACISTSSVSKAPFVTKLTSSFTKKSVSNTEIGTKLSFSTSAGSSQLLDSTQYVYTKSVSVNDIKKNAFLDSTFKQ